MLYRSFKIVTQFEVLRTYFGLNGTNQIRNRTTSVVQFFVQLVLEKSIYLKLE